MKKMRLTEYLDRTGVILTPKESKALRPFRDDEKTMSEWMKIFMAMDVLEAMEEYL